MREFGFIMPDRKILVNDVRVRGIGKTEILEDPVISPAGVSPKAEMVRPTADRKHRLSDLEKWTNPFRISIKFKSYDLSRTNCREYYCRNI